MGEVANIIVMIASVITAVGVIIGAIKVITEKITNKLVNPLTTLINDMDVRQCRGWLVAFLGNVENGINMDEVQYQFAHEIYDHYTNDLKENSYIHDKWTKLMS